MHLTPRISVLSLARWAPGVVLLGIIIGAVAIIALVLPAPLYRYHVYGFVGAFETVKGGMYGGILAIIISITGLILVLLGRQWRHFSGALIGIVLGASATAIPRMWISEVVSAPAIHDISTDTANPPRFGTEILAHRKPTDNSAIYAGIKITAIQAKHYPDIQPLIFNLPATTLYAAALRVLESMGWKLDFNDPVAGILEATSISSWFGFKYDVVIRIRAVGDSTRLDIRSESRQGDNDAGKNAQLIRAYRAALYKQLGLQPLTRH